MAERPRWAHSRRGAKWPEAPGPLCESEAQTGRSPKCSGRPSVWLGLAQQGSTSLGEPSAFQHAENFVLILEKANVGQRIAGQDEKVRKQARPDLPDFILH